MTLLTALTTLVDAARQLPENPHLDSAIKVAEKRIDRLQAKRDRRMRWLMRVGASPARAADFADRSEDVRV